MEEISKNTEPISSVSFVNEVLSMDKANFRALTAEQRQTVYNVMSKVSSKYQPTADSSNHNYSTILEKLTSPDKPNNIFQSIYHSILVSRGLLISSKTLESNFIPLNPGTKLG